METGDRGNERTVAERRFNRRVLLRATIWSAAWVGAASLLAACTPSSSSALTAAPAAKPTSAPAAAAKPAATTAPAQGKTRDITFLLDITPYGKHALFYAGLDHGDYAKHGFNVNFQAAKGSADSAAKMGAKAADFGFSDAAVTIQAIAQGAKLKQVFMVHYKNLMTVISLKKFNIAKPPDLEEKTIAATSGDAPRVVLPALAKINNFDASKVKFLTVDQPAKAATILAGQSQGAMDYYTAWPAYVSAAKQQNEEMQSFLYADYGLDIYNNGVIVHQDTLDKDAAMVKEFLQALGETMKFAVESPDEATKIFLKHNPALAEETARAQLQVAIDHLVVPEAKEHGIGPMDKDKWQKTLDVATQYFDLARKVTLDEVWTNDYAPKGVIPKA